MNFFYLIQSLLLGKILHIPFFFFFKKNKPNHNDILRNIKLIVKVKNIYFFFFYYEYCIFYVTNEPFIDQMQNIFHFVYFDLYIFSHIP